MSFIELEGKKYPTIEEDVEKAFLDVGILTFNYFPQDKIFISTKSFSDFFNCEQVLHKMPGSLADALIHTDDRSVLFEMAEEIDRGHKKVSANLRTKEGFLSRVTVTAREVDENGNIIVAQGVVEKIESDIRSTKAVEALSNDYSSVYYVDLMRDAVFPHRLSEDIEKAFGVVLRYNPPYEKIIKAYIENMVLQSEKKDMEFVCSLDNLRTQLSNKKVFIHDYRIERNGEIRICRMKVVNISDEGEFKYLAIGFSDMSAEKTAEVENYAYADSVTGGNNYNAFKKNVTEVNLPGYLICMDIDRFKVVNTVCGIKRGDKVLKEIWKVCNDCCSNDVICARVNADVFVFYSPNKSDEYIIERIKKVTEKILELSEILGVPKLMPYFGISQWNPEKEIESVFGEAVVAKNEAKKKSKINYLFYTEEETKKIIFDRALEDAFVSAMQDGMFEVWHQPKYNPHTDELIGAEALIRWRLVNGELLPPAKFIPLFEADGLIKKLDEYVFYTVCKMQKRRVEEHKKIVPISINLSRVSIFYGNVVETYKNIVKQVGIDPKYVPIEITESAAVTNKEVQEIMMQFHEAGFPILMDDFGSGYSSLSALNNFPIDTLKIDKSLVDYIGDNKGDRLLKHVVNLSKDLGMSITAEGVESQKQVDFLRKLDCDSIQGYFYSKPLSEQDFLKIYK